MTTTVPRPRVRPRVTATEALAKVAISVTGSSDHKEILVGIVHVARSQLNAERASILLLDERARLSPAVSVGRLDDHELWLRFREMEPIDPDLLPLASEVLAAGRAVALDEVTNSPLVPERFRVVFGLRSVLLAPLTIQSEPLGVLVIDHGSEPHRFSPEEVNTAEGIAALAAMAVQNAHRYAEASRRTAHLDRMLGLTGALNAARGLHQVLQVAIDGFVELLSGVSCSVTCLGADGQLEVLASRGAGQPEPRTYPASAMPAQEMEQLAEACAEDPVYPLIYIDDQRQALREFHHQVGSGDLLLLPLADRHAFRGFVLVELLAGRRPDPEQTALAASVAAQVWLAIDRARLSDDVARRLRHLELLYRLSDDVSLVPDIGLITERLAGSIRAGGGGELIDVLLCDPSTAKLFAASQPPRKLSSYLTAWRRGKTDRPRTIDGLLYVPMLLEHQLVGLLRVRPAVGRPPDPQEQSLMLAIAEGVAEFVARTALRAELAANQRELAVAGERDRIGRDLHDTLGQQLIALGAGLDNLTADLSDDSARERALRLRAVVGEANTELRQAIHALTFLEHGDKGLAQQLRGLVRDFDQRIDDTHFLIRVSGPAPHLPPAQEEALFRVAQEALTNAIRHARASTVTTTLAVTADRVTLTVIDDGVGLSLRGEVDRPLHFGLRTMRRRMTQVGGVMEIKNRHPRGVRLMAWIPQS